MTHPRVLTLAAALGAVLTCSAAEPFVCFDNLPGAYPLISDAKPAGVYVDRDADSAVIIAADRLCADFEAVCGTRATVATTAGPGVGIVITTWDSPLARHLVSRGIIARDELRGKREKYIITAAPSPCTDVDSAVVIVGSDRRGTVYGIYELSEQLGVSPCHWWADVPAARHDRAMFVPGVYTDGEPAVEYRGIFLNDEAPALTTWVRNRYGTDYGDHRFYADVFELILRLRGNFMWPAMWGWAFYADDPLNSATAQRMGIIMGTSHHEPMARNHQEWARRRDTFGAWNYRTNRRTLDDFFTQGIRRMRGSEDVVTIGMRGDGDEAMGPGTDVRLLQDIVASQRRIISRETGRPARETPQVWALYKEVLDYYDAGLRVPDDVIMLLCDDNWGNVRRLPDVAERRHPGGWGMYYHVDYVGAPRNSKWLNCTPIQNMWEQLSLTYDYGVDRLWILNVGDLKPMEYPITLFMDMAWNPRRYTAETLIGHTRRFCTPVVGEHHAATAADLLDRYCKLAGRCTPEMLDADTYDLPSGEWQRVADEWMRLETEALRLLTELPAGHRDAYHQLILFPIQAMANLHDMYYALAQNRSYSAAGDPRANEAAGRVKRCFERDAELCRYYNKELAGGKWDGMMTQKHIGYTSWNDDFAADTLPPTDTVATDTQGGYTVLPAGDVAVIEAEHYHHSTAPDGCRWTVYPRMGRTFSGVALTPYTAHPAGSALTYRVRLTHPADSATVHFVVKSTLAFSNPAGHRFRARFADRDATVININHELNEHPDNIYTTFYPTVARRVIEKSARLALPAPDADGCVELTLEPLDPGIVFETVIIDPTGSYRPLRINPESPVSRR